MRTSHHILTLARTCALALVCVCVWICLCAGVSLPASATTLTSTREFQSALNNINDVSLANNASYATPATIPLAATVTPAAGTTITRIEVYAGATLIASNSNSNSNSANSNSANSNSANSNTLNTTWITLKPGTQTLTARAIDSNGGISTASVIITVISAANETITFLHNDLAGSPMAATDIYGAIVWKEDYTPFGERKQNEATSTNQHQWFGGKVQDSETGLSYFGARYYDPVVGRFMGVDAVGFNPGNLHSFNRYAYANNNPYRFVDPDGNDAVDAIMNFALGPFQKIGLMRGMNQHREARDYGSSMQDGGQYLKANLDGVQAIGDVTTAAISVAALPVGLESAAVRGAIPSAATRSGLGDLTSAEAAQIQNVVNTAGRPLEVVGSAASGTRRGVGTNLPIGKGAGTRSDIDYLVPPSSMQHFEGLQGKLPGLDPKTGIIPGTANKNIGPAIRFEPTN